LRALHVSDIHIDFEYTVGSLVNCNEYLCCHSDKFPKKAGDVAAGEWGSNGFCDLPMKTY